MKEEKFDKFNDFLYGLEKNLKKHMKDLLKGDYNNYIEIQGCGNGLVAVNRLIGDLQDAEDYGYCEEAENVGELCSERGLDWLLFDMFAKGCNLGHVKELMKSKLNSKVGKEIIQDLKEIYERSWGKD